MEKENTADHFSMMASIVHINRHHKVKKHYMKILKHCFFLGKDMVSLNDYDEFSEKTYS